MKRKCIPGIDLPGWFYHEIKGIDNQLEFIWHKFRTLYDDIMNTYSGSFEDSRYYIHNELGQELWGFPLISNRGTPLLECAWHIWRRGWPHGYSHVVKIESLESRYLNVLLSRLHLQANASSARDYQKQKANEEEAKRLKEQKDIQEYKRDIDSENSSFFKKALENAQRGIINPTNPTKDSIISYSNQKNRSRIVRPLEDEEGGLIVPSRGYFKN